ncbi:MAG: hypothetical protein OK474_02385 [Thaumarchaeota archaeon]|nr:hypothetical protein [Nitrososphaerota archaeon]
MGRTIRVARAIFSILISVVVILFLYGYLAPVGLSPSILGPQYGEMFGTTVQSPLGALIPGGIVGLLLYTVLSRVGSVASAAAAPNVPSPDEMMRRMDVQGMMGARYGTPASLPADITKSQLVVLRCYRQGYGSSKDVGRALSMDAGDVEKETQSLRANGYLSKDNKITSKAMELLGT